LGERGCTSAEMAGACGGAHSPQVDSVLIPERESLCGAVVARLRQRQCVDVSENGVDLGSLPQLANRYESVSECGDASNVSYEHNSLFTLLVMAYHWEVPDV
jgi:hypothetical protein